LLIESLRRAGCDRQKYLGDPDFVKIDINSILDKKHAIQWQQSIDMHHATPSNRLTCDQSGLNGKHTTHYSILDRQGNAVSATLTINTSFGSGFVVPNTGVLLNNEMNDFAIALGYPNSYGQVGNQDNMIAPGKRPLSNMTPTFISTPNGFGILGSPGGAYIPTVVMLGILSAQHTTDPTQWVNLPRFHHQNLPDVVEFEPKALSLAEQNDLKARGHQLKEHAESFGNMQAIFWDKKQNKVMAASDPRGQGTAKISN